jgi:hypothetical protein
MVGKIRSTITTRITLREWMIPKVQKSYQRLKKAMQRSLFLAVALRQVYNLRLFRLHKNPTKVSTLNTCEGPVFAETSMVVARMRGRLPTLRR